MDAPRVTIGVATLNRDDYLGAAVSSCLEQDFASLEVLVVLDGTTNPRTEEVLAGFAENPRLRIVRHPEKRGIAAAYNTFVSEGRGELIAMLGDDDICLPGRIRRQVAIFDAFRDTGVVHGDATVIDADGRRTGTWGSREFTPSALRHAFWHSHNHLVDPTRMVHRRVYETVGGYDAAYPLANDFDFWVRAAERFRFRHAAGGPLVAVRRHAANTSDATAGRAREVDDVERVLTAALERSSLRALVPELDWPVLDPREAERQALGRLADAVAGRLLPLPGLAARLRARAAAVPVPVRAAPTRGRLLMTSFGFDDPGGGTTVPRLAAKELARRGWEVTVFLAATAAAPNAIPYEISETEQDGVRLVGVHDRAHGLLDIGRPDRELDDPPITAAFEAVLDGWRPDVVHFHNLHNLGAALIDCVAARGIPAHFTTHNYWLICPRAYLLDGQGAICPGPGDGSACASCVGHHETAAHAHRLAEIRARAHRGLTSILAVSEAVRTTLVNAGYDPSLVDVVRQAMPHEAEIWAATGRDRAPGRAGERLAVAFLGSAYPHKGPQLLVEAAQRTEATIDVRILGEVPPMFEATLRRLDRRGVVRIDGAFSPSEIGGLLGDVDVAVLPSLWWDCAPLAAAECLAAGTPLLVSRLGGLPEAIRDGVDGLTFAAGDADDLARRLDRLAGEPGLLERLQAGIEAPRSFAAYVDELEACYRGERPGAARFDAGAAVAPDPVSVRWVGDHGRPTSLSIVNDEITARLPGPVQRVAIDGVALDGPLPHTAQVEVRHGWPPDLSPARSGRLAVVAPWEFGAIPRDWIDPLRANVDELWVPSEYVRGMYLDAGLDPERIQVIPNGVDLATFAPEAARTPKATGDTRFLFVGGLVWRKGPDLLFDAYTTAFAGRDDVTLVIKDFGADGPYRDGDRDRFRAHVAAGARPRIELLDEILSPAELAALYRSCDVFVTPYRGEGFAMPVLEAMACGLPVIATAGGPTDEFLPETGGWRIRSHRVELAGERVGPLPTAGRPWVLEPDRAHLTELLRVAAATDPSERARRGAAGRAAAQTLGWDAIARRYAERIAALAARPPRPGAPPTTADPASGSGVRVLATPAWRGEDRLAELLAAWARLTGPDDDASLVLLADTRVDGEPAALEAHVLAAAAAAGVDLDACGDVDLRMEPAAPGRDRALHAQMTAYVPLHAAAQGHARLARRAGVPVLEVAELAAVLPSVLAPA